MIIFYKKSLLFWPILALNESSNKYGGYMFGRPFNIGFLALAIYLILVGISSFAALGIPAIVMGIIALIAGIFILIGR